TGDTVSEISMGRPPFVTRTVSKWSTRSPRRMRARMSSSSDWRSGGIRILTERPTNSADEYPNIRSAAALQDVTMPSRSFAMIASSDDSTMAARNDWAAASVKLLRELAGVDSSTGSSQNPRDPIDRPADLRFPIGVVKGTVGARYFLRGGWTWRRSQMMCTGQHLRLRTRRASSLVGADFVYQVHGWSDGDAPCGEATSIVAGNGSSSRPNR